MEKEFLIRAITADDVDEITRLRCLMFQSMGYDDPEQLTVVASACRGYFDRAIAAGQYRGWLALTASGAAVATVGVVVDEHPPGPVTLNGRIGYIMNLYTDPAYRRQGLARQLFDLAVEWIRVQGFSVAALHATDMGRLLYAQFGFSDSNEMRVRLS